jgi:hypothetical protein
MLFVASSFTRAYLCANLRTLWPIHRHASARIAGYRAPDNMSLALTGCRSRAGQVCLSVTTFADNVQFFGACGA